MRAFLLPLVLPLALVAASAAAAPSVSVVSPDGSNRAELSMEGNQPQLRISRKGEAITRPSQLGILLQDSPRAGKPIGASGLVLGEQKASSGVDEYTLPVGKARAVKAPYRQAEVTLNAREGSARTLKLILRAYDDGVAFRYVIPGQAGAGTLSVAGEATSFRFAGDYDCWGLNQGRFENSFEGEHDAIKASRFRPFHLFQAPVVCKTGKAAFAIAEADSQVYPGAWYSGLGEGDAGVKVVLAPRRDNGPDARSDLSAARIDGTRDFATPWRVMMLGDSVGRLVESNLITTLAAPSKVADTSWIKPGLSAWDWWNGNQFALPAPHNAGGQKAGMNTATYKAYVDFAASLGLPYILIDEGWSRGSSIEPNPQADVTRAVPAMDMPEIIRYAQSKNVGVWLWLQWKQLDNQMDEALAAYQRWGVKGVKIDFMNRNDQDMMAWYDRLLSKTAQHRLMVDLHGAFPPTGLARTWPHYLTQEGVLGAENNKWSQRITARHNINLAFTRGLLGPMDYTPGGFRHLAPAEFAAKQRFIDPYVMTTRGAALAMYVIYESPLQMVADSPPAYRKADGGWEDGVDFIRAVPTSWDETRFLGGDLDEHVAIARRKGDTWYVGAMTDKAKQLRIPLGFLGEGSWTARTWQDGATVSLLRTGEKAVRSSDSLALALGANGGAVAVIERRKP